MRANYEGEIRVAKKVCKKVWNFKGVELKKYPIVGFFIRSTPKCFFGTPSMLLPHIGTAASS